MDHKADRLSDWESVHPANLRAGRIAPPVSDHVPVAVVAIDRESGQVTAARHHALTQPTVGARELADLTVNEVLKRGSYWEAQPEILARHTADRIAQRLEGALDATPANGPSARIDTLSIDQDDVHLDVLVITDLTDWVAQMKALTDDSDRFRALVEAMFDAYYDWDIQTGLNDCTEQMDALVGLPPGGLPRTCSALWARIHEDDMEEFLAHVDRALHRGGSFAAEYRLQKADGSYAVVDDRGIVLTDAEGQPRHLVGAMRDVTQERHDSQALEDRNAALRVLMEQGEADRRALDDRISANVEKLLLPTLDRLQKSLGSRPEAMQVAALRKGLLEITSPFGLFTSGATREGSPLTRRESEVASLVRSGKTTAEIAEALYLSPSTVTFHRQNIRRKIGLTGRGCHLTTHLAEQARVSVEPGVTRPDAEPGRA